ncbi:hypothetical protein B0H10DRAFT_2202792 [Mycena sp. CBHHK59/15]|nr:hypothetical protein B0H10DRAFT_2202792 [Mycena sp. CBHHK59/15]
MATGKYSCNICPGFASVHVKHIPEHERSERHLRNLKRNDQNNQQIDTETSTAPASVNIAAERVRGPLSDALEELVRQPDRNFSHDSWVDEETGVVNWNSDMMDIDTHLQEPLTVRNTAFLMEQLHAYRYKRETKTKTRQGTAPSFGGSGHQAKLVTHPRLYPESRLRFGRAHVSSILISTFLLPFR